MADNMRRMNSLLFDNKTTSRTDYCDGNIRPIIKTVYQEPPLPVRAPLKPLKCNQTMSVLRGEVPFTLYHRSKEIVREDPRNVQKVYGKFVSVVKYVERKLKLKINLFLRESASTRKRPNSFPTVQRMTRQLLRNAAKNLGKKQDSKELLLSIQKSRPRVYMTPAISLDDVEEPTRESFINAVYQSTAVQAMEAVVARMCPHNVKSPLSPVYAPPSPIKLKPVVPSHVSPEWRMKSVSFDSQQLRSYVDPTKEFWLARTPKCNLSDETATRVARQKMRQR